ncbi:iron ABC transporter substrate-binding protein [Vagococcus penaei]|uniref:Iron ABC transporter substrate-binding protein n=1 Tax=Vagococcus penaei TaxID=633807 RepID=A0A1Q2D5I9_9ENTE|nr:ABC transporter substrate-binding protein [Vagococcus penaei]AQP53545.1 iron ABC transporter substrate-binding protein [Vagococcus penaei]RSU07488.1 iron ABC transporter substrate-binding protein [Vagococcus penaei]
MKKGKNFLIVTCFIGLLVLGGCGAKAKQATTMSSNQVKNEVATVKTIQVTDSQGKDKEVPVKPSKVVVFDMGALDTINSLGDKEAVIGVPTKTLPSYLKSFDEKESVGGIKEPDFEKINALKPDLIIISGRQEDSREMLEKIAPTLYLGVDANKPWESTKQNIQTLGTIFDKKEVADKKIAELDKNIATLNEKASNSQLTGLVTLVNEGSLSAYGSGSRFGIVYDTFGVLPADTTIKPSTHGQDISYEYILEKNPDILFVVDRTKAIGGDTSKNNIATNELILQTKAGQTDKVISLTPDVWYLAGGGIESTQVMIDDIAKGYNK